MTELYDKYNVVHIEGCRYYIVDLKQKEFYFENTLPYCCVINGVELYESSWKNMIFKVAEELDRVNPKSEDELLSMRNSWGKQEVFGLNKKSNFLPFKGLFINVNHTAVHAMWTVQLLMNEYGVNLDDCKFILRRLPLAEPKEIREYEKEKTLEEFKDYLLQENTHTEETAQSIIKNIEIINAKVLPSFAKGYHDLFLIENPTYFYNYSGKALKILKEKMRVSPETLRTMEYAVEKLEEYTKMRYKNNKILFDDYKIIDTKEDDIISDFNDFDDF